MSSSVSAAVKISRVEPELQAWQQLPVLHADFSTFYYGFGLLDLLIESVPIG